MANKNNFKSIKGGRPMGMKNGSMKMTPNTGAQKQTVNPAQMISRANKELEDLIQQFGQNPTPETMQPAVEKLRDSIVFIAGKQAEPGKFDLTAALIKWSKEGEEESRHFLGVFTSLEQIKPELIPQGTPITTLPFGAAAELFHNFTAAGNKLDGVMVNPQGKRFAIPSALMETIHELEKLRRETGERKPFVTTAKPKVQMPKVENPEVDAIIVKMGDASDPEERNELINQLYEKLWNAHVIIPSVVNSEKKLFPAMFEDKKTGDLNTAVYTSMDCMKMAPEGAASVMTTFAEITERSLNIAKLFAEKEKNYAGLRLFAPDGHAVLFPVKLLERFVQVAQRRQAAKADPNAQTPKTVGEQVIPPAKKVELPPQVRAASEHVLFELRNLPKKLFEEGQTLIDDIYARRETCFDELFEASYTNVREYPYLEEDFSVLAVTVREDLEVIRVDFPEQDQTAGCASRAYLVWNPQAQKAQYYALLRQQRKDAREHILKIEPNDQITDLGETVIEGNELSHITELASEKSE